METGTSSFYSTSTSVQKRLNELSRELSLPPTVIAKVYKSYWLFIRKHIESLPLKEDLSEEEFKALSVNFNLPNLGKLGCTYKRYLGMKKRNKNFSQYVRNKES